MCALDSDPDCKIKSESASKTSTARPRVFSGKRKLSLLPMKQQSISLIRKVWAFHFMFSLLIITYSSIAGHGERKYIPIDPQNIDHQQCRKAYVDVFSPSIDYPGALICCTSSPELQNELPLLCQRTPSYIPFASRLAKFPDAWLLPLFPMILRGIVYVSRVLRGYSTGSKTSIITAKRRAYLYLFLFLVRGWVLYMVLNEIEDIFVEDAGTDCWYQPFLPSNHPSCHGRVSDFSDHIVLYFGQILPIALFEVLCSLTMPFWNSSDSMGSTGNVVIPTTLVVGLLHLYLINTLGAYKTTIYFHTGPEVFTGYIVSLCIQIPLCLLQCTRLWPAAREYLLAFAT